MEFFYAVTGVISIIIMVSIGYFLTMKGWFNQDNAKLLPKLINYVSLPAYMLWNLMNTFDKAKLQEMLFGLAIPVTSMLISFVIGVIVSNVLKIGPSHKGTFRSVFFCSSAVFVGVPVNLALFGESSIPYVLLYFLANAFLFWTIGNYSISTDGRTAPAKLISIGTVKNIFSPPFIGFVAATSLIMLGITLPKFVIDTARYLGGMTTPLSMIFIGIVMFGVKLKDIKLDRDIIAVLIGRFVVSPLVVILVAMYIPVPLLMKKVFVIQAALPAMTQTTVMAKVYEADTEYAAVLVSITTIFAIIAIPIYMIAI